MSQILNDLIKNCPATSKIRLTVELINAGKVVTVQADTLPLHEMHAAEQLTHIDVLNMTVVKTFEQLIEQHKQHK